ncbi:response regulator [Desertifilum sp. FACHB-1129]|uniref:Response regulator receiver protein n=1 Tax=Desertifilum tharense IPPAS B-1220 TaxID=1781255 RepID=A0A1E5QND0_9CYAN|nr:MULTISPECIES: response regulator [Desertifilum]MDA0210326.1 response regulator [Cyanobacteria bacterium FC1]MBD2310273.1 response regulator [Desertifilum sp. FACHB-1129]MBD2322649.1 response regulator [Desertifilum sp. FACHB-866]MBD2333527.1 response regulator [Desertifilum sp. FACHB-868]OEJ76192.1 response regulator receiver protein [Desertifilum tharense IPPAS B-1220]
MNFEEILEFVEATLEAKAEKPLTSPEKEILKAAWDNETYSSVADSLYLSVGYIKDLASLLWQRLSDAFGEKITKNNFRWLLEAQSAQTLNETIENMVFSQPESREGNIFVVDDVTENVFLLTQFLTKQGYKVRMAKSAKMALKAISHHPPDLILLDILMPDMNGYEVCQALKCDETTSEIPVIFLSALEEPLDKVKAFNIGAADYISKPIQLEETLARIQTQLTIQKQKCLLKKQIEQHQQTVEILYQSRALLANVLNSSKDGISALQALRDPLSEEIKDFRCLVVNPIFAKLFDRSREELMSELGLKNCFFKVSSTLFTYLVRVVETGQSMETGFYWKKNNQQTLYYFSAVKFGDGCLVTVRNITHLNFLDSQLNVV